MYSKDKPAFASDRVAVVGEVRGRHGPQPAIVGASAMKDSQGFCVMAWVNVSDEDLRGANYPKLTQNGMLDFPKLANVRYLGKLLRVNEIAMYLAAITG